MSHIDDAITHLDNARTIVITAQHLADRQQNALAAIRQELGHLPMALDTVPGHTQLSGANTDQIQEVQLACSGDARAVMETFQLANTEFSRLQASLGILRTLLNNRITSLKEQR